MTVEARAVAPGLTGTNPPGTPLTVLGGNVMVDGGADVRSTLDLTVSGVGVWPEKTTDALAPYGQEVFVRRGVAFGNGTVEWVSLGYFRIISPEQSDAPDGPIRIAGRDRMSGLIEARLTAPQSFSSAATFGSVVSTLVQEVYPGAVITWDDGSASLAIGRQVVCEEDRFRFLNELLASLGKVWYWNHRGELAIRTPPSPTDPVFDVNYGEGGVLVRLGRRLTREGVYNAVVVTGDSTGMSAPPRAVAIDNDPASPTYWHGSFGKVPRFFSSPLITSTPRAEAAAATMLRRELGVPAAVDFSAVPNPALEPYDPVRIVYGSANRPGVARSEVHILDRLTIPLIARDAMSASTRVQADGQIDFI
ncbi:DUF5047 domain-containing protein [Micromonospora sp. NPDC047730]|uniref:DUF5047 domain-containing protein n=1 Tax=Micromonospora sp. NPDC047730 TaxID=3364253 RepID=UPI003720274E